MPSTNRRRAWRAARRGGTPGGPRLNRANHWFSRVFHASWRSFRVDTPRRYDTLRRPSKYAFSHVLFALSQARIRVSSALRTAPRRSTCGFPGRGSADALEPAPAVWRIPTGFRSDTTSFRTRIRAHGRRPGPAVGGAELPRPDIVRHWYVDCSVIPLATETGACGWQASLESGEGEEHE